MTHAGGGDSFTFNNVTTHGPAAFGPGATAFTAGPVPPWLADVHRILGDLHREWPRAQASADPAQVQRVQEALTGVQEQLRRPEVDRAALKDRLTRLSTVVATVAGLAGIAERIREWMH